jgi:uncharacterized phage infection (PIP) family protein YhgE
MRALALVVVAIVVVACAQVPKESVQLSATVGRDMAEIERSHRALVNTYYDNVERSINRFVDQVYAPYQISQTLEDPDVGGMLADAIAEAAKPGADAKTKKDTFEAIGYYFQSTRDNIEQFRSDLLKPIKEQRSTLLQRLDDAYRRVQNGNSIVTGYLASVVKLTEEQNKLMAQAGLPDLGPSIAQQADKLSQGLGQVEGQVQAGKMGLNTAVKAAEDLVKGFEQLPK